MSISNILSIDIDYAYSPTISVYDNYVEGTRVTLEEQRKILDKLGMPIPKVNPKKIKILKKVVKEKTNLFTPIIICQHHNEILNYLPKNKPFNIVNFDHHHDVHYPGWHDKEILDEGNWVHHLNNSLLEKYLWIRNSDSEDLPDISKCSFTLTEEESPDISKMPDFDMLFFCVSSHWTGNCGNKHILNIISDSR
tara:strand:+ start:66 stop:647 length:582 start_codon:yes stop_codon:yes gene_type:complete